MSMTEKEARIILLEDALDQAVHTIRFMHGCLTQPATFKYSYPEHTVAHMSDFRQLVAERPMCIHSFYNEGCPGCEDRVYRMHRRTEAAQILGAQD